MCLFDSDWRKKLTAVDDDGVEQSFASDCRYDLRRQVAQFLTQNNSQFLRILR